MEKVAQFKQSKIRQLKIYNLIKLNVSNNNQNYKIKLTKILNKNKTK